MNSNLHEKIMKNSHKKVFIFLAIILIFGISGGNLLQAGQIEVIPMLGYSSPMGDQADQWKPGYSFGFEGFGYDTGMFDIGGRLNVRIWRVNAAARLALNGHDMTIEKKQGIRYIGDLSVIARYYIPKLQHDILTVSLEGGLGAYYVRQSAVELKGFYPINDTAVNREIHEDRDLEIVPGINLGINLEISRKIKPSLHYEYIMTSDESTSIFLISVGILAQ